MSARRVNELSTSSEIDFEYFKRELTDALGVIKGREAAIRKDVRGGLNSDSKERAVQLENSEVLNALSDDAYLQIEAINRALARIDSGDYGICEECGADIPVGRLKAYPQTVLCTSCAERIVG